MATRRAKLWTSLLSRLRVLLSLLMVTAGAIFGGLSLTGYYEPRIAPGQAADASITAPESPAQLQLATLLHARQRFVAVDEPRPPVPAPPAKPKTAAKPPSAKTKAVAKDRPEMKPARPEKPAAPWLWSLFGN